MAEKMEGGIITVEELRVLLKDANIDTVRKYINIYGVLTVQIALLQNAMMEKLALPNIKGYPPQVFISYRWENEAHKLWVLKLARFLERSGFHVHFDQNDLDAKAGLQEVPAFVSSIAAAQYALVINSPGYIDRVTARKNQTSWVYDEYQNILSLVKANRLKLRGILVTGEEYLNIFDNHNMIDLREYSEHFDALRQILPFENAARFKQLINQEVVAELIQLDQLIGAREANEGLARIDGNELFASLFEFKFRKMQCLALLDRIEEASAIAGAIVDESELNCNSVFEIIDVLRKAGDYKTAIRKLVQMRKSFAVRSTFNTRSDELVIRTNYFDTYPALIDESLIIQCHFLLANLLDEAGSFAAAINHFTYVHSLLKNEYTHDRALILNNIGYELNKLHDFARAEKILLQSIQLDETSFRPYENLVVCYAGLGAKDKAFLLLAGAQTKFPSMIDRIDDLSQFVRQSPPAEIHEQKAGSKHYACDTCGSIFLLDPELEILCGDCGSVGPMGSLCQACGNDGIIPLMMLDIEGINVAISCPTCLNGTLSRQR